MIERFLPDANIFLHALNADSGQHQICRNWLDRITAANQILLINDLTECALLRVSTLPRIGLSSMPVSLKFWESLQIYPFTKRATPGASHQTICSRFITELGLSGNDVNDAWLAALAIEQRATLVSTDTGFARFSQLRWLNPASKSPN